MRKRSAALLFVFLILAICLTLTACTRTPVALSASEFAEKAEEKGCEISEQTDTHVEGKFIPILENREEVGESWKEWEEKHSKIDFTVYDSEKEAKDALITIYNNNSDFINRKEVESNLDPEHYHGYEISDMFGQSFLGLYRVDNTLLIIITTGQIDDEVEDFTRYIGYR